MIQLQSFQKTLMVLLTAPLGLIGVAFILLTWNVPFGFVANLGVIALFGMIMRNSVILVDQIEQDIQSGQSQWQAIVEATVRRFRPIVLTAACGGAGDDSALAQHVLGADGGGDHGGLGVRNGFDLVICSRALCRMVPGEEGGLNPAPVLMSGLRNLSRTMYA